jgi:hypothetical protein
MIPINRISNLRDPDDPQGRSYGEVNAVRVHKYPIGALVELNHGVRLFVVHHARDCDQTPLYCLAADPNDTHLEREGFYNPKWVTGIAEQYLTLIRMVNAPEPADERLDDIRRRAKEAYDPNMGHAFTKRPSWTDVNYLLSKLK